MAEVGDRAAGTAKGNETRQRIFGAAGINKQRIYAYFGDKEGLFVEVWQRTSSLVTEEGDGLFDLDEDDIPELGRILLRRYVDFHDNHPGFWHIFVLENLTGNRHHPRSHEGSPYAQVRRLYEQGQRDGHFSQDVSFESFLFVLMAVTFFYASNHKTMSDTLAVDLSRPEVKARIFDEISHMLFGGDL